MNPGGPSTSLGGAQLQDQQMQEQQLQQIQQFLNMQQMNPQQNQSSIQQQNQQNQMQQQNQQNNPMQMQMQVNKDGSPEIVVSTKGQSNLTLTLCSSRSLSSEPSVFKYAAAIAAVIYESNDPTGAADGDQWHVDNAVGKYDAEHCSYLSTECDECGRKQ